MARVHLYDGQGAAIRTWEDVEIKEAGTYLVFRDKEDKLWCITGTIIVEYL